jgi:signal peptidase
MTTAALDVRAARPASAFGLASAAARLVLKAAIATVVLGLVVLVFGPTVYPFQSFYVRSASMSPAIPVGALVIAERAAADELRPGDVIVFQRPDRPGTMVVHRIDAIEEKGSGRVFVTKGDANGTPDGWHVPATGDGWRAVYSISGIGFTVGWLHGAMSRNGWIGALAIVAALYALTVIWRCEEPE